MIYNFIILEYLKKFFLGKIYYIKDQLYTNNNNIQEILKIYDQNYVLYQYLIINMGKNLFLLNKFQIILIYKKNNDLYF